MLVFLAEQHGRADMVKMIVQAGLCKVDARDDRGATPLICASLDGHTEMVLLLLELGADVNATQVRGVTALMSGCMTGHVDIVRILLQHGAKKDATDMSDFTLHLSMR